MAAGANAVSYERPKRSAGQVLRRLAKYFKPYRVQLVLAVALSIAGNLLALVSPKLSGAAIDAILPGHVDFPVVGRYVIFMVICAGISTLMSYGLSRMMIRLSRGVVYQMRKELFERLGTLPVSFFDTHQTGDVISVFSYDVDTVNASLSNDLTQMLSSVITVGGSLYMMLTLSPLLVLVFAVTIPMSMLFTRYRAKRVRPLYRTRSRKLGEMNGYVEETVSGLKTIKAYGREEVFLQRFHDKSDAAADANYNADAFGSITGPSVNFVSNLSLAMVSLFGALMYIAGQHFLLCAVFPQVFRSHQRICQPYQRIAVRAGGGGTGAGADRRGAGAARRAGCGADGALSGTNFPAGCVLRLRVRAGDSAPYFGGGAAGTGYCHCGCDGLWQDDAH